MTQYFWNFTSLDDIVTAINGETRTPGTADPTPGVGQPASMLPDYDIRFSLEPSEGSILSVTSEIPVVLSLQGKNMTYDRISDPSPSPPVISSDM